MASFPYPLTPYMRYMTQVNGNCANAFLSSPAPSGHLFHHMVLTHSVFSFFSPLTLQIMLPSNTVTSVHRVHSPAPSHFHQILDSQQIQSSKSMSPSSFSLKVWLSSCLHRSFYLHRPIEAEKEWDQGPKLDSDCTVLTWPPKGAGCF